MAKKKTPLEKIRKELDKLEALHAKEEAIVEKITDIIDEGEDDDIDFDKWEGTKPFCASQLYCETGSRGFLHVSFVADASGLSVSERGRATINGIQRALHDGRSS